MKFISLFSGVGGFDLGFENAGMECVLQVEQDKHALDILNYHWPNTQKMKDVRDVTKENTPDTDVICGGFPCQDISLAGKREGLAGNRSGLWFEFYRIIEEIRPKWVVIENVSGLLSSNRGRDMGTIIVGLAKCGYWWAYRMLDSKYFGVPQRRRRVFIVASLTAGSAAKVLFEQESGKGDINQSGKSEKDNPGTSENRTGTYSPISVYSGDTQPTFNNNIAPTLKASESGNKVVINTFDRQSYEQYGNETVEATVSARDYKSPSDLVAISPVIWESSHSSEGNRESGGNITPTLSARTGTGGNNTPMVGVRRLTPLETERLQGFPDDWTLYTNNGEQADSHRYKQMGNAVTVPVVQWIAERIIKVEKGEL